MPVNQWYGLTETSLEVTMSTRILFFGDKEKTADLYCNYLRSRGYEVLHFASPLYCTLMSQKSCTCSPNQFCADIIITEVNLEGMTGLELVRLQIERGCNAPPNNKAILSAGLTKAQEQELCALGCIFLKKPFRLMDLIAWVNECEKNIPPHRKLVPHEELFGAANIEYDRHPYHIESHD
jgi:CheY-like chemotaxis protein